MSSTKLLSVPRRTVAASVAPVHLDDVKPLLRLSTSDIDITRDAELERYIEAATDQLEADTLRQFVAATFAQTWECFPPHETDFVLERLPLLSVSSIQYYDLSDVSQTWASSKYIVHADRVPPRIESDGESGYSWPDTRYRNDAVTVTWVAGHAVPLTVDSDNDQVTSTGHTFAAGDSFRLSNTGGTLPAGLSSNVTYYVVSPSSNTFSLSLTAGGSAVSIDTNGSGQLFAGVVPQMARLAICHLVKEWYCGGCPEGCTDSTYESLARRLRWEVALP